MFRAGGKSFLSQALAKGFDREIQKSQDLREIKILVLFLAESHLG